MTDDPAKLQTARALWMQSSFEESLNLFDEVLEEMPDHPLALIDAARANGSHYRILKAEQLLDRYLTATGETAEALALAGPTYRMIHRSAKALDVLEQAVTLHPMDPATVLELALLLDRAGRGDEARQHLTRVCEEIPEFMEGAYFLARLEMKGGDEQVGRAALQAIAENERQDLYLRSRAYYDLAEHADREGQAKEALRWASLAKSLAPQDELDYLQQIARLLRQQGDQITRALTTPRLKQWQAVTHPPVTLLTGSPRSGTTLLEKVLDAHPGICSSDEHDLFARFLSPAVLQGTAKPGVGDAGTSLLRASDETMQQLRLQYFAGMEELLGEPLAGRLMLDKNPSLTEAIPTWLKMLPHSKILMAIRDPRDVVLSCYLNYFPLNAYSLSFQTLEQTARRYAREMKIWLELRAKLPVDQWFEVCYEDCVADLAGTARGVLEWMGLPWDEAVLDYREKLRQRLTQSPTYADVQSPIYTRSLGRWRAYEAYFAPLQPILAPYVKEWGYAEA